MKAARKLRKLQQPQSLIDYVRQFLTPAVWKQARQAVPRRRAAPRWDLQPLVLVMMAMTWAAGDSQPEKFETARGFYVACYTARKRPGKTLEGFQKALGRIPMRQFQGVGRRGAAGDPHPTTPSGCSSTASSRWAATARGSSAPAPPNWRRGLRQAGKEDAAPTVWLTAFVHLPTGLLWSWRLGPGDRGRASPPAALAGHPLARGHDRLRRGLYGL